MKTWLLVALALLVGASCANYTKSSAPTGKDVRLVIAWDGFVSYHRWENTGWFRITDSPFEAPFWVLIASDQSACIVDATDFVTTFENTYYACKTGWRRWRP